MTAKSHGCSHDCESNGAPADDALHYTLDSAPRIGLAADAVGGCGAERNQEWLCRIEEIMAELQRLHLTAFLLLRFSVIVHAIGYLQCPGNSLMLLTIPQWESRKVTGRQRGKQWCRRRLGR